MQKTKLPATERVVSYVNPSTDYWVIPSDKGDMMLAQTLLPSMTQDQAANCSTTNGFHTPSLPEYFELFDAIYVLREKGGEVEKARNFIRKSMRTYLLNTLTRILYQSDGMDKIIQGYGTKSAREEKANVVGSDGNILDVLTKKTSLALTGKSPEQVAELMEYMNETPTYILRLNEKPQSLDERVVSVRTDSDRFRVDCFRVPQGSWPALGVKKTGEASAPKIYYEI